MSLVILVKETKILFTEKKMSYNLYNFVFDVSK